jgi:beta-mannosidase
MRRNIYSYSLLIILLSSGMNPVSALNRQQVILKDNWLVKEIKTDEKLPVQIPADFSKAGAGWYKTSMPKQVQELVLENGKLPDPHYGDNAAKWTEVFEQDWVYIKCFNSPESTNEILLCFNGLDTRADIILNGQKIAECNSMFRHFRFPVKKILKPHGKENILMLRFYSPTKYIGDIAAKIGKQSYTDIKYLRKTHQDFGSYLGARPNFLKMGIFDDVFLDVVPSSYFDDVYVRTILNEDYSSAKIIVCPDVKGNRSSKLKYILNSPDGKIIKQSVINVTDTFSIDVDKPEFWWPFTYGKPSLYQLSLSLLSGSEETDKQHINIGIRDVKMLLKDRTTGEDRFGFIINGKSVFMNGACWAPLEGFTHVWNEARANRLLDLMVWGNMNIVRVWGEGSIPGKSFYDECDKRGILVWQEFMTGGGMNYPLDYPGYRKNIEDEAENMIKLLRNHPSIAMWCGGNEHYLLNPSSSKHEKEPLGRELFEEIFPSRVTQFDPGRYYHSSSPWGGDNWPNGNYPLTGDFHDYSTIRYQSLATVPLFTSEACMVSPYSYHNMKLFMPEEELWPKDFTFKIDRPGKVAWPDGWQKHTTADGWQKTGSIQDYIDIQNCEEACRIFGTAHGVYLEDRYERQRRGVPDGQPDGNRRSWGAMAWRLNDTWPMIYMSVVDYYLEPKIPYYFLKRACDPVLVSFEQTTERISTWVTNDSAQSIQDSLIVELWTFDGIMKSRKVWNVNIQPGQSRRVADLTSFYDIGKRKEFFVARLGNRAVTHLLYPEKYLMLPETEINAIKTDRGITLTSAKFVKGVELYLEGTSGAVFSDNYFNLIPGEAKTIKILFKPEGSKILKIKGVNSLQTSLDL